MIAENQLMAASGGTATEGRTESAPGGSGSAERAIVYFATRTFWKPNSGHEILSYNYCKYLHEELGYQVHVLTFLAPGQVLVEDEIPDFVASAKAALRPSLFRVAANLLRTLPRKGVPLQTALYAERANDQLLKDLVDGFEPAAVMVDMIRLAPYVRVLDGYSTTRILCLDDLLSVRYREQLRVGGAGDFAGSYGGPGSKLSGRIGGMRTLRNSILRSESRRVERAELEYAGMVDAALVVSKAEADVLNGRTGRVNTLVTAMGVDVDYFSEPVDYAVEPGTAAFVGNMAYGPNVDSLRLIRDQILPKVKSELRLKVIGNCPDDVRQELSADPRIEVLGRVDDMRPVVRSCALVLAPVAYGSGVKTKIIEALAMGMCIVTNSVGAQSIDVENGVHLVVEDDPVVLAARVDALLADDDERHRLSQAAASFADRHCRWSLSLDSFKMVGL